MTESRRSALRKIWYDTVISETAHSAYSLGPKFHNEARDAAETAFTTAIAELFVLLKKWEKDTPSMSLSLKIMDFYTYSDGQKEMKKRLKVQGDLNEENSSAAYARLPDFLNAKVNLGPLEDLPQLKSVKRFHVGQLSDQIYMTEDSMTRLAMKFPALEKLHLELGDMHRDDLLEPEFRYGTCKKPNIPLSNPHNTSYIDA